MRKMMLSTMMSHSISDSISINLTLTIATGDSDDGEVGVCEVVGLGSQ